MEIAAVAGGSIHGGVAAAHRLPRVLLRLDSRYHHYRLPHLPLCDGGRRHPKQPRQTMSLLLAMLAFVAIAAALDKGGDSLRSSLRWLLGSRRFKAEVLAQPSPRNGELRHMEWDATGFAGVANSTLYIVFDPSDALATVTRPVKAAGIPCEVPLVRRLEKHWYAVRFYTDEEWGDCPWSNLRRN